jgi:hypothetical protein
MLVEFDVKGLRLGSLKILERCALSNFFRCHEFLGVLAGVFHNWELASKK